MFISCLVVENFLCHRKRDIRFSGVDLFAGFNGAGKTSLLEAIRISLLGNSRAPLKKLWPTLVLEGHKKGSVTVNFRGEDGDDEGQVQLKVPSGTVSGQGIDSDALPFLLGAQAFSTLKANDRKALLFSISGSSSEFDVLVSRLNSIGLQEPFLSSLVSKFRAGGFSLAESEAKTLLRVKRASWEETTGEKYGADKAEDWTPTDQLVVDDPDPKPLEDAKREYESAQRALESAIAEQAKAQARASLDPQEKQRLAELSSKFYSLEKKVKDKTANLQAMQIQFKELEREGRSLTEGNLICPSCKTRLVLVDGELRHGLAPDVLAQMLQQSRKAYRELRASIAKASEELRDLQTQLADSLIAGQQLEADSAKNGDSPDLESLSSLVETARAKELAARQAYNVAKETYRSAKEVKTAVQKAEALYQDILVLEASSKLLSPSGLQQELVLPIVERVNSLLSQVSEGTGWGDISLTEEMDLQFNGRPFFLLSESEQWRVEFAMQYALAVLSGLNLCVVDRVDVLDLRSRAQFFRFAYLSQKQSGIQFIMAATMKELPAQFPFPVHWLETEKSVAEQVA